MNLIPDSFMRILADTDAPINMLELVQLLAKPQPQAVFIKNTTLKYVYANPFFIELMGLKKGQKIAGMRDMELCTNKALTDRYQAYDMQVLETGKPIHLYDIIQPEFNENHINIMEGKEYPLYGKKDQPEYVLGIVAPTIKPVKLDWNTLFCLDGKELDHMLCRKFYFLNQVRFSRREIQILMALMKGHHAGEIAVKLQLKQSTVESYLVNIKNKIGVNSKSELIHFLIDSRFLEQIAL